MLNEQNNTTWNGIDTNIDKLSEYLSHAVIPNDRNILGIDIDDATCEFFRYVSCYDRSLIDIERKVSHSLRVALLCNQLTKSMDGSDEEDSTPSGERIDVGAMTLAGLLHDIGRFPQYAIYRSYHDNANECDHGELSYELLTSFGMLSRFINIDGTRGDEVHESRAEAVLSSVTSAIRIHNKRVLPDRMSADDRFYATTLRNADIIDILDIAASPTSMPHDPKVATESASSPVMTSVRNHQTVDRTKLSNNTDILLSRMALTFAVEGKRARKILNTRRSWEGYLVGRDISGNAKMDIEEALDIILEYLE